ncbi:MAG: glutamate formimidoyltransferase [bacterium]
MKLVECVPNFSEGKDMSIINSITSKIEDVDGVKLLDVDPGADTNRTVVTFVGTPDEVVEAAFSAIEEASGLIDMRKHSGAHPRMGATDVCPFVPVQDITVEECNELVHRLAKRVGEELDIPVYLYEHSATAEDRRNLATIRKGQYEAFEEKIKDEHWKPDYGTAQFNARSGVTAIGVRDFLVAYNVNINSQDRKKAHDIALDIRERGRAKRDENHKIIRDENGKALRVAGRLKACKAIGWYIDDYGVAQISMNLTNTSITMPHEAFEVCREEANKRGLRVTGSELVGLIPKKALIDAGRYYLEKQGKSTGIPEKDIIHIAIKSMGLDELGEFDPQKKIIEYAYDDNACSKLISLSLKDFADELSTDSPAPGGGSVAALSGALAGALTAMVSNLTHGKREYAEYDEAMVRIGDKAQAVKSRLIEIIDEDTDAFNELMSAFRMKKKTDAQKQARKEAVENATKKATGVPFEAMETIRDLLDVLEEVEEKGNPNSVSDAGVAALNAVACCEGAYMNVLINLQDIEDEAFVSDTKEKSADILKEVKERCNKLTENVYKKII